MPNRTIELRSGRTPEQVSFTSFRRICVDGLPEVQAPPVPEFVEVKHYIVPTKAMKRRKLKPMTKAEKSLLSMLISTTSLY